MFYQQTSSTPVMRAFRPEFVAALPQTADLLRSGNLVLHEGVARLFVIGSRGLDGTPRPDSDIDLSLHVDMAKLPVNEPERETFLQAVLDTTLANWRGAVDLDLAAVFDTGDCCGLRCFRTRDYDASVVRGRGIDCFGIYKVQRGFNGYVTGGVELAKIYPIIMAWEHV